MNKFNKEKKKKKKEETKKRLNQTSGRDEVESFIKVLVTDKGAPIKRQEKPAIKMYVRERQQEMEMRRRLEKKIEVEQKFNKGQLNLFKEDPKYF